MFVFKCKMCGGDLNVTSGTTISTCEYCGSTMTLPRLDDDRRAALYERANHFRRMNEYDKAAGIYDTILNEDRTDSEAYWSLVLCKYGVEYVKDPQRGVMIPTCNRTVYQSIFSDEDYKQAQENAAGNAKDIYAAEAEAINEIQKGIIAISSNVKPYDVFICYKETDANGRRTADSVLAQNVYDALVDKNLRVFFARITLEDKLGSQYEPYIFSALNSAKIMLVIGTAKEHMEAVWVKNEWTRFLAMTKKDKSKVIIPCYKDMDAYGLPEELLVLQSQDMNKLGFLQDLTRGIKKIIGSAADKQSSQAPQQANVDTMLQRAFNLIDEYKRDDAEQIFNKILEIDPNNARAYFGMALVEAYIYSTEPEKIAKKGDVLLYKTSFKRAMELADESFKEELLNIKKMAIAAEIEEVETKHKKGKKWKAISGVLASLMVLGIATAIWAAIIGESIIGGPVIVSSLQMFPFLIWFIVCSSRQKKRRNDLKWLKSEYGKL